MITKQFLMEEFRSLGMTEGDTIFVHSAYSSLARPRRRGRRACRPSTRPSWK